MEVLTEVKEVGKRKRGRKKKGESSRYELNLDQSKFFVDLSKANKDLLHVQDLLVQANDKDYGEEVTFREIALAGIDKLNQKDIEKIRDNSISAKERLEMEFNKFKEAGNEGIDFWEFLDKHHKQK